MLIKVAVGRFLRVLVVEIRRGKEQGGKERFLALAFPSTLGQLIPPACQTPSLIQGKPFPRASSFQKKKEKKEKEKKQPKKKNSKKKSKNKVDSSFHPMVHALPTLVPAVSSQFVFKLGRWIEGSKVVSRLRLDSTSRSLIPSFSRQQTHSRSCFP